MTLIQKNDWNETWAMRFNDSRTDKKLVEGMEMAKYLAFDELNLLEGERKSMRVAARHVLGRWQHELAALAALIKLWRKRSRQRKELAQLPEFMLKDIGVTRGDVDRECSKPFWRA